MEAREPPNPLWAGHEWEGVLGGRGAGLQWVKVGWLESKAGGSQTGEQGVEEEAGELGRASQAVGRGQAVPSKVFTWGRLSR